MRGYRGLIALVAVAILFAAGTLSLMSDRDDERDGKQVAIQESKGLVSDVLAACRTQPELAQTGLCTRAIVVDRNVDGLDGQDGADGLNGATGARGVAGANGQNGAPGIGTPGRAGLDGAPGVGINGTNGTNGVNGRDGIDGKDGAPGAQGPPGPPGPVVTQTETRTVVVTPTPEPTEESVTTAVPPSESTGD